jgi:hypothetical protein
VTGRQIEDGQTDRRIYGWMIGRKDGLVDGWMDVKMCIDVLVDPVLT